MTGLSCPGCGAEHPLETATPWLYEQGKANPRFVKCCNARCGGRWGTGCYHCHHPRFGDVETARALARSVAERTTLNVLELTAEIVRSGYEGSDQALILAHGMLCGMGFSPTAFEVVRAAIETESGEPDDIDFEPEVEAFDNDFFDPPRRGLLRRLADAATCGAYAGIVAALAEWRSKP